jgi:hypothetical protein
MAGRLVRIAGSALWAAALLGASGAAWGDSLPVPADLSFPVVADPPAMPRPVEPGEGPCDPPAGDLAAAQREGPLDNLSVFLGIDGSKQPQDLGINANFGGRFAMQLGLPLLAEQGLGVQLGTAVDYALSAVHVIDQVEGTDDRWQSFTTVGVFQRTPGGFRWGLAYDFLFERYYDDFAFGQWRGQAGYAWNENNEAGLRCTISAQGDDGAFLGKSVHLRPITQGTLYLRHTWATGVETGISAGLAERHGTVVALLPDNSTTHEAFVFGADVFVPLNDWAALVGAANFITPNDTGTVDAYLGIAVYPGRGARQALQNRFAPLLPVAGNPEFAVDLRR